MRELMELKDRLLGEVKEMSKKDRLMASERDMLSKNIETVKNIDKILMMSDGGEQSRGMSRDGYSRDGYSRDGGSYDSGNSYGHYVRGHYSRDDGYSQRGGYSRNSAKEQMTEQLERMLRDARSDRERKAIEKCLDEFEKD